MSRALRRLILITSGVGKDSCLPCSMSHTKLGGRVEPEVEELRAAVHAELAINRDRILVRGCWRDPHLLADLFLAQSIEQEVQSFLLSGG